MGVLQQDAGRLCAAESSTSKLLTLRTNNVPTGDKFTRKRTGLSSGTAAEARRERRVGRADVLGAMFGRCDGAQNEMK